MKQNKKSPIYKLHYSLLWGRRWGTNCIHSLSKR